MINLLNSSTTQAIEAMLDDEANLVDTQLVLVNALRRIDRLEGLQGAREKDQKHEFVSAWLSTDTDIAGLSAHQIKRLKSICQKFFEAGFAAGRDSKK